MSVYNMLSTLRVLCCIVIPLLSAVDGYANETLADAFRVANKTSDNGVIDSYVKQHGYMKADVERIFDPNELNADEYRNQFVHFIKNCPDRRVVGWHFGVLQRFYSRNLFAVSASFEVLLEWPTDSLIVAITRNAPGAGYKVLPFYTICWMVKPGAGKRALSRDERLEVVRWLARNLSDESPFSTLLSGSRLRKLPPTARYMVDGLAHFPELAPSVLRPIVGKNYKQDIRIAQVMAIVNTKESLTLLRELQRSRFREVVKISKIYMSRIERVGRIW